MIKYTPASEIKLQLFSTPFERSLASENRWVKMAEVVPWDKMARVFFKSMSSDMGRGSIDLRTVLGALLVKHIEDLGDEPTIEYIQENIYVQYFVGLPSFTTKPVFVPSLFVEIRKRLEPAGAKELNELLIETAAKLKVIKHRKKRQVKSVKEQGEEAPSATAAEAKEKTKNQSPGQTPHTEQAASNEERSTPNPEKGQEEDSPDSGASPKAEDPDSAQTTGAEGEQAKPNKGTLKMDASVFPQNITYPTDTKLVNKAREITEDLIDKLYKGTGWWNKKPRTYRRNAAKRYLSFSKTRNPNKRQVRKCVGKQLRYIQRNLNHLDRMLDELEQGQVEIPWGYQNWRQLWIVREVYRQQLYMYQNKRRQIDDRIVSIPQPHVRPIMRGKAGKKTEFGAKAQVCETEGFVWIDYIDFNNFNESGYLVLSVEGYKRVFGYYPEVVLVDKIYLTKENRKYLKSKGIRHCGPPLGRPPQMAAEEKKKRKKEQNKRSTIEGKFGTAKTKYGLEQNEMKLPETSIVASILTFMGMNALKLQKEASFAFFYALLRQVEKFWWRRVNLKSC